MKNYSPGDNVKIKTRLNNKIIEYDIVNIKSNNKDILDVCKNFFNLFPKMVFNDNNSSVTTDIIENPTFIKYYWYNSGFLAELIKTVEFIVLVGIFEYLFFAYIVNKFKIANSKTILCGIYKKIN